MARILIVDDEPAVRLTIAQALQMKGHEIAECGDGNEAVAAFPDFNPDLVITDILMPNKEGIETIMELRKLSPDIKIIAMSGGGRTRNMNFLDVAREFGCDATIKKPFNLAEIQAAVAACLPAEI